MTEGDRLTGWDWASITLGLGIVVAALYVIWVAAQIEVGA